MGGGNLENEIAFECPVEFPETPFNQSVSVVAMASLKAPAVEIDESEKRAPIDVICVIDRSGSMAGSKLTLTKKALDFVVDQLDERDFLGVVTYDTEVATDLQLIQMTSDNKKKSKEAIHNIRAGSMTNLSGGLLEGLSMASTRKNPQGVCSVLLFTDGLANHGITSVPQITAAAEKKLASCPAGTSIFTFGFGSDHDANMLRSIATAGRGMYYFIETVDQIPLSFADCIGGLQSVVAQNIRLKITAQNGAQINQVLSTGFKTDGTLPGNGLEVFLGDLYSEEARDFMIQVTLPGLEAPQETFAFLELSLHYFNVLKTEDDHAETRGAIRRTTNPALQPKDRNKAVDLQLNRIKTAAAMEQSKAWADQGRIQEARQVLLEAQEVCRASASAQDSYVANLCSDMDEVLEITTDRQAYASKGQYMMMNKAQSHAMQRSNDVKLEGGMYSNMSKAKKKAFFS